MERRKFINLSFTSLLAAPAAAGAGGRVFGTPDSIAGPTQDKLQESLVLSLERMKLDVGSEASSLMVNTARVWSEVITDDVERKQFYANPERYLASRGIPKEIADRSSKDIAILRIACSDEARSILEKGDMRGYLEHLRNAGLGEGFESEIGNAIRELIEKDREGFRQLVSQELSKLGFEPGQTVLTDQDIAVLAGAQTQQGDGGSEYLTCGPLVVICAALVAVAIAAIAALYVAVGVALGVGLLAAVAISLLFELAVAASTSVDQPVLGLATPNSAALSSHLHRMQGYGKAYDTFRNAARAAELAGSKNASLELVKTFIAEEVRSIVSICEEMNLIRIEPRAKEIVLQDAIVRCQRAAGLTV